MDENGPDDGPDDVPFWFSIIMFHSYVQLPSGNLT
jgi:hypothetical protein